MKMGKLLEVLSYCHSLLNRLYMPIVFYVVSGAIAGASLQEEYGPDYWKALL